MNDIYITVNQAAAALGVSPNRLRRWKDDPDGLHPDVVTATGKRFYSLANVRAYAQSHGYRVVPKAPVIPATSV